MARVWVLTGHRKGDNAQARALAHAISSDFREIRLEWNYWRLLPNWLLGKSLRCIPKGCWAAIHAPWPDLVIGIGRRSVPVARWIKKQSDNHVKVVQLGNPRCSSTDIDLIITTPQYPVPDGTNVLRLALPFSTPSSEPKNLHSWRDRWDALPRPITGIILGGNAWPFVYTRGFARSLLANLPKAGTHLIVTSPRTPDHVVEILRKGLKVPHQIHAWREGGDNPYHSLLLIADRLAVCGDSVSMFNDVIQTEKPLSIILVPKRRLLGFIRTRNVEAVYQQDWGVLLQRARMDQAQAIDAIRKLIRGAS